MKWNAHLWLDFPLFYLLTVGFMLATVVGTLSHEAGHYVAGRVLGYKDVRLHYGSVSYDYAPMRSLYEQYGSPTLNPLQKKAVELRLMHAGADYIVFVWWGPLQTMLTGSIGFLLLLWLHRKRPIREAPLPLSRWLLVFVALFWLRQLANFSMMIVLLLFQGRYGRGDEGRLAHYYHLPPWLPNTITALISVFVLIIVVFKFIPARQRFTFIVAGLCGGITGFGLWMYSLGPLVLP